MERRFVSAFVVVVVTLLLGWAAGLGPVGSSSGGYTVEVISADGENATTVTAFDDLTAAQQEQFVSTRNTRRSYDSSPVLLAYAGEYVRHEGEVYVVIISST